jgi:uncharacterized repeat protein (TIGR03803 family)
MLILGCGFVLGQAREKVLWSFAGSPNDGAIPIGNLISDKAGNLYGVTQAGGAGAGGGGIVFKLSPSRNGYWTETVLYNFCSNYVNTQCLDGSFPQAGLALDSMGNLYGTAYYGGSGVACGVSGGCGVAFELSPPSSPGGVWTETIVHNFCTEVVTNQCLDGDLPASQLVLDGSGNLYGTTGGGGAGYGNSGTVFEFSRGAGGWEETVLYNFCSLGQESFCPDGLYPRAGVIFDKSGNLYGTTTSGGSANSIGGGTVYELSPGSSAWSEAILLAFPSPTSASDPEAAVSFDGLGNLYTTFISGGKNRVGGVVRLTPYGALANFSFDGNDGASPGGNLLSDSQHNSLVGTTEGDGEYGGGTVYKITAFAQGTALYSFCQQPNCADGVVPVSGLIEDSSGNLYGTAKGGGADGHGVVFEVIP